MSRFEPFALVFGFGVFAGVLVASAAYAPVEREAIDEPCLVVPYAPEERP